MELQYHPLPHRAIRLLRLDPDVLALETVQLEDAPAFYAVSHCWGDGAPECPLRVGGRTLLVRPDLAAGISRLRELAAAGPGDEARLEPALRRVWIDTVCINQDDVGERSAQVALMGDMYSASVRTLVWLGPAASSPGLRAAWRLLDLVYAVAESRHPQLADQRLVLIPQQAYSDAYHAACGLPPWDDDAWEGLERLEQVPWFSRLWVVQEVVLSAQDPLMVWGRSYYSWHRFSWAFTWLRRKGYTNLPHRKLAASHIRVMSHLRWSPQALSLETLICLTNRPFRATDPRDKVYGLLGFLSKSFGASGLPPSAIAPQYAGTDAGSTYQRVARFLMETSGSLLVMTSSGLGLNRAEGRRHLASWAPDWNREGPADGLPTPLSGLHFEWDVSQPLVYGYHLWYAAAANLPAKIHRTEDEGTLRVSGMRVDTVSSATALEAPDRAEFGKHFGSALARVLQASLPLLSAGDEAAWVERVVRVTTMGHDSRWAGEKESVQDGAAYIGRLLSTPPPPCGALVPPRGLAGTLRALSADGVPDRYGTLAAHLCFGKSFFTTAGGRMGCGPADVCAGDVVSVLLGGGVPFILRRNEGGETYALVGESYVNDYMNGEAVRDFPEEILDLR